MEELGQVDVCGDWRGAEKADFVGIKAESHTQVGFAQSTQVGAGVGSPACWL